LLIDADAATPLYFDALMPPALMIQLIIYPSLFRRFSLYISSLIFFFFSLLLSLSFASSSSPLFSLLTFLPLIDADYFSDDASFFDDIFVTPFR